MVATPRRWCLRIFISFQASHTSSCRVKRIDFLYVPYIGLGKVWLKKHLLLRSFEVVRVINDDK